MIMAETENTAHLSAWRNSASLSVFKMLNSKMKEAKENSITQRLIIQCADYSGFLLCPPLPLVSVITPFHCSLAPPPDAGQAWEQGSTLVKGLVGRRLGVMTDIGFSDYLSI